MTTEPIKVEINCETGETTYKPLTDEEILQAEKDAEIYQSKTKEILDISQAREEALASALAKLEALGLTEEEARALVK